MIKNFLFFIVFLVSANSEDTLVFQKQNTLYVQNLIEREESIGKMFEKYLLTEFKIPTLSDLITNDYLGVNFSLENKMGVDISFENISELKIKYSITEEIYRKNKRVDLENYLVQLYNRDLYRDYTGVYDDVDISKSFVQILLKSDEAKNIFEILNNGNTIAKTCESSLVSTYCNNNKKTIRWYNASSQWIEYDKINFNKTNITISSTGLLNDSKLNDLAVGSYIFVENTSRYIKLLNEILKVD